MTSPKRDPNLSEPEDSLLIDEAAKALAALDQVLDPEQLHELENWDKLLDQK